MGRAKVPRLLTRSSPRLDESFPTRSLRRRAASGHTTGGASTRHRRATTPRPDDRTHCVKVLSAASAPSLQAPPHLHIAHRLGRKPPRRRIESNSTSLRSLHAVPSCKHPPPSTPTRTCGICPSNSQAASARVAVARNPFSARAPQSSDMEPQTKMAVFLLAGGISTALKRDAGRDVSHGELDQRSRLEGLLHGSVSAGGEASGPQLGGARGLQCISR